MTSDNKPRRTTKPLLRLLIVSATVATPEVLMPTQVLAEPGPTVSAARTEILDHHRACSDQSVRPETQALLHDGARAYVAVGTNLHVTA